jgi:hypothetical protein
MADLHHHHHGESNTTIVEEGYDREGPATALIVLLILAFVGFMIWLLAFSGVVFHRGTSTTNNNVRIQNPVQQSVNPGGNNSGGGSPSPMSS